jgi:uncharacterized protein (DUF433 family)
MKSVIEDGGRIDGLRITVFDVYYYRQAGRQPEEIAAILGLSPEQVAAALGYIDEHRAEVRAVHQRIEERIARGNPPEIEARRATSRASLQAWLNERRQAQGQEVNGAGNPGGR